MKTPALAAALCAAALLVSGCGGDDDTDEPTSGEESSAVAEESPTAEEAGPDAEAAIQDYFAAQRAGAAAAICALEDESWQVTKYGEAGDACLADAANNTEQAVWADPVTIVTIDEVDGTVTAVLEPNASTPDQATIVLTQGDDGWLVTSFR